MENKDSKTEQPCTLHSVRQSYKVYRTKINEDYAYGMGLYKTSHILTIEVEINGLKFVHNPILYTAKSKNNFKDRVKCQLEDIVRHYNNNFA